MCTSEDATVCGSNFHRNPGLRGPGEGAQGLQRKKEGLGGWVFCTWSTVRKELTLYIRVPFKQGMVI